MDVMRQSAEEAEFAALAAQYGADLASEARAVEASTTIKQAKDARLPTLLQGVGQAASIMG